MPCLNRSLRLCLISACAVFTMSTTHAQTLTPGHQLRCLKIEWPKEALRKEMTGTVTVAFTVTDTGTADVKVVRSSGWKLLDDTTARALRYCTREPGAPAVEGEQRLTYAWALDSIYGSDLDRLLSPKPPGSLAPGPYLQ